MTALLTDLLAAGLIENLGGDDERFEKMERAAKTLAGELVAEPPMLIGAILAGLDPDVPAEDPAIAQAERALVAEWKSMNSVHTNRPIKLFRAILLEACAQSAEGKNAAILWLTAADTLPLLRIGKEESVIRRMLETLAMRIEQATLASPSIPANKPQEVLKVVPSAPATATALRKVNREELLQRIAAATGQNYRNTALPKSPRPNPHWTNSTHEWSWEFSDRMRDLLANELDALTEDIGKHQNELSQQVQTLQAQFIRTINDTLISQQRQVQSMLEGSEVRLKAERLRVDALWWSEALYSHSVHCSYRELPSTLAAVVMAVDLLDQVTKPTPASLSYLLSETVNRLPEADFGRAHVLPELLGAIRKSRERLPKNWTDRLSPPPTEGRLSLRDLVILALGSQELDLDRSLKRAGLIGEISLSLPALARALFRQEQAVQLAGGEK